MSAKLIQQKRLYSGVTGCSKMSFIDTTKQNSH